MRQRSTIKPDELALADAPKRLRRVVSRALSRTGRRLLPREVGRLLAVEQEVAWIEGLPEVGADELLELPERRRAMAFNLDVDRIGAILLDEPGELDAGDPVRRTGRVIDVPVGNALLGRVIDPTGRPLDGRGPVHGLARRAIEREALGVLARAPVSTPLQTGIKVVDALVPIGRGQRELIVGDRQTGKTAIAVDTILNQRAEQLPCVYCAVGQRSSGVAEVVATLARHGAMRHCTVVATTGDDPAGVQFIAPYAAMTVAEWFCEQGRDALVVFDDLTRHARAYRELSLLLRRPPGREAYPGDIFYIHARLLERATHRREGGTVTALPIVETQAENISAYIPTNLISITDGQIYLSPHLVREGVLPAVDVGRSVSRVGGDAQLPAFRAISGDLRISYSQFEELERFSRFGTKLDPETRVQLEHGRRIRQALQQGERDPYTPVEQIAVLFAAGEGLFDAISVEQQRAAEPRIRELARERLGELGRRWSAGEALAEAERELLRRCAGEVLAGGGQ